MAYTSERNGASITYTLQCTVAADAIGDIVNDATISGAESDPTPSDNVGSDITTAVTASIFGDGIEELMLLGR